MKTNSALVLCWALILPVAVGTTAAQADVIHDGGFETTQSTFGFLPDEYGIWEGDLSEIVDFQEGFVPFEGTQMLKFIGTKASGGSESTVGSELWQLIDLSPFSGLVSSGQALVTASAAFYRVEGDPETIDTQFNVLITAYEGTAADFPTLWLTNDELARSASHIFLDEEGEIQQWVSTSTQMIIPSTATFLAIRLGATENIVNDPTLPEFAGHYADAAVVTIQPIPAPAAAVSLIAGFGLMAHRRRRRH